MRPVGAIHDAFGSRTIADRRAQIHHRFCIGADLLDPLLGFWVPRLEGQRGIQKRVVIDFAITNIMLGGELIA